MDYKKRMRDIYEFLKPYQNIWQNEIMLLYPNSCEFFNKDWLSELVEIKDIESLYELEKKMAPLKLKNETLIKFYRDIDLLTHFPQIDSSLPEMPFDKYTWLKIIPKKQHEIKRLAPLVNDCFHKYKIENIIDIGGGIGLLSQTINNAYNLPITSVDMNSTLQETGKKRHLKNSKQIQKVTYKNLHVSESEPEFIAELGPRKMTLGLHTCGPLAISQIKASAQNNTTSIINLGCCYLKLNDSTDQNISEFSKSFDGPLILNQFATTLACGAHRKVILEDVKFKRSVKMYRYGLHILLVELYNRPDLVSFGNSSEKVYEGTFAEYVKGQFQKLSLSVSHSDAELNRFHQKHIDTIYEMYVAGFIRDALSRVLEVYLLLDRVIYLQEQSYDSNLVEIFDENLSPRNLAIIAHKK